MTEITKILNLLIKEKIKIPVELVSKGKTISNTKLKKINEIFELFNIKIQNETTNNINIELIFNVISEIIGLNMKTENTLFSKKHVENLDDEAKEFLTFIHYLSTYGMDVFGLERNPIIFNKDFNFDEKGKIGINEIKEILEKIYNTGKKTLPTFNIVIVKEDSFIENLVEYIENISKPITEDFFNNIINFYIKKISNNIDISKIKFKENKEKIINLLITEGYIKNIKIGFEDSVRYVYSSIIKEVYNITSGGFLYNRLFRNITTEDDTSIHVYNNGSYSNLIYNTLINNAFKTTDIKKIKTFYKQSSKRKIINKLAKLLGNDKLKELGKEYRKNRMKDIRTKYYYLKHLSGSKILELIKNEPSIFREDTYTVILNILNGKIKTKDIIKIIKDAIENDKMTLKSIITSLNYIYMLPKAIELGKTKTLNYAYKIPGQIAFDFKFLKELKKHGSKKIMKIAEEFKELENIISKKITEKINKKYGRLIFKDKKLIETIFSKNIKIPVSVRSDNGFFYEEGSSIQIKILQNFFSGIYWEGKGADLDLYSLIEDKNSELTQIRWQGNKTHLGVKTSGDITDGLHGASEIIYSESGNLKGIKTILLFVKLYARGELIEPSKAVIGSGKINNYKSKEILSKALFNYDISFNSSNGIILGLLDIENKTLFPLNVSGLGTENAINLTIKEVRGGEPFNKFLGIKNRIMLSKNKLGIDVLKESLNILTKEELEKKLEEKKNLEKELNKKEKLTKEELEKKLEEKENLEKELDKTIEIMGNDDILKILLEVLI